jgi:caspase domain-containing protein
MISDFVLEENNGQRSFVNVDPISMDAPGMNRADLGWIVQGLQTLLRPDWYIQGFALACGASGRVLLLDKIVATSPKPISAPPQLAKKDLSSKAEAQPQNTPTGKVLTGSPPSPAKTDHRIALVVGNSAYESVPALANPERDARLVAATLKRTGFDAVTLLTDLRKDQLVGALQKFALEADKADWAVIYYAGHGMEVGGTNYLVPINAKIASDRDINFEAVPLEQVLNAAERAKKLHLVILDACRDNPFKARMKRTLTIASRSVSTGLAAIEPEAGTLVVYAAKDGQQASDGDGINSPFALAFVKEVQVPGIEVRRLFDLVRDDVMEFTDRQQQPFSYGSISGRQDFYFVGSK